MQKTLRQLFADKDITTVRAALQAHKGALTHDGASRQHVGFESSVWTYMGTAKSE